MGKPETEFPATWISLEEQLTGIIIPRTFMKTRHLKNTGSFLLAFALLVISCKKDQQGEQARPEFKNIKRAPVLQPLQLEKTKIPPTPFFAYDPIPPAGSEPSVRVSVGGEPFEGDTTFTGNFNVDKFDSTRGNLLTFLQEGVGAPESSKPILIGLALPENMKLLPPEKEHYSLYIRNRSSLKGAGQVMTIKDKQGRLFAGYIWELRRDSGIAFSASSYIQIYQKSLNFVPHQDTLQIVPALLEKVELPLAKVLRFSAGGRSYLAFVRTSAYRHVTEKGSGAGTGYMLRALVIATR
jgi:hypothetical protein